MLASSCCCQLQELAGRSLTGFLDRILKPQSNYLSSIIIAFFFGRRYLEMPEKVGYFVVHFHEKRRSLVPQLPTTCRDFLAGSFESRKRIDNAA